MTDALFLLNTDCDNAPVLAEGIEEGWTLTLPPHVKRHAIGAMRLQEGDTLQLSDGNGLRIHATVTDTENGLVKVDAFTRQARTKTRIALVQALAKTGHDEQAIDMATQIGVDEVIPWCADRSIAKWKAGRTDKRWKQVLHAATEQSRRAFVPELQDCMSSKQIVAICRRACVYGNLVVVLHQDATDTWNSIEESVNALTERCLDDGKERTVYVLVGPEGGISEDEVSMFLDAGAHSCVLGSNILRASTAGPVAISLLSRALGRYE
ncbi:16S rRNA (uracil(1498)-N(3))-methyltransferase [Gardnerella sp. 2492-Sm]|uniref:16S rRNA (uracil(1498)-N(3))-methyltransferase n=1 Tax=unclassified Gardnerella TaxID=2628112 RepID=UPI003D00996C